jgi:biopolymer transport protein ExbB
VPVLIRLFDGNFRFTSAQADGSDIRFVADDGKTVLTHHFEKIDPLLNEAFVWVKVPDLKPGTPTVIWLYYGNTSGKAGKVEDAKGTYDENTVLVYHFNEHGQPAYDATGNGHNAQNAGVAGDGSMIGTGLRLDGRSGVQLPAAPALAMTEGGSLTWSAWVRYVSPQPNAIVYSRQEDNRIFLIGLDNGMPFVDVSGPGGTVRSSTGPALAANSWSHLAVVASGTQVTLYVNGDSYAAFNAVLPAMNSPGLIGGEAANGAGFKGELDELEIAKIARSPSAIKLAALSQGSEAAVKFIAVGEDEQQTSWLSAFKTGYIGVIVGSLTPDGWAVIGILFVMSIISWVVMVRKATYLNGIGRGNVKFLNEWSHIAFDLSAIEDHESDDAKNMGGRLGGADHRAMVNTPLYRIYHIGIVEVQHRLAGTQAETDKVLSARSMQAIRAALDGGLVRETQRLNSSMVLLTIAISGGPFLGLLGTVVGVMITFAAVAAAGEVNVNAIAPGIAAALLATVAGLGVAIPALFGYNYLLTRIKVVTSDMHVFIDEFVTKLAEFYSEPNE